MSRADDRDMLQNTVALLTDTASMLNRIAVRLDTMLDDVHDTRVDVREIKTRLNALEAKATSVRTPPFTEREVMILDH